MLALFLLHAMLPILIGQQQVSNPTTNASVCNMTKGPAPVEVTLVGPPRVVPQDECIKFDLGAPDSRTLEVKASSSRATFSGSLKARDGSQTIYLVMEQKSCPHESANRICIVGVAR